MNTQPAQRLFRLLRLVFSGLGQAHRLGTLQANHAATLGWFIGSVSTPSGDYFFATRATGGENPSGRTARKITESIPSTLKVLP